MFENFLSELWEISIEAAPFLCLGFLLGALLHRYVKTEWMMRLLGKGKIRSTITAAAIGVPLPLCSCSVVPTALAIQKKGASRGATMAFLISTPETGVDSVLLTYGLLGPIMAVARPLAALFSAIMAGLMLESLPEKASPQQAPSTDKKPCCCATQTTMLIPPRIEKTLTLRIWEQLLGIGKSFLLLFDEVVVWLLIGLTLSAIISTALPEDLLASGLGSGWKGKALALVMGLPLYVCATASTPLAAVLMEKGLSAGAALVFLLVGPATNIGTMGIVTKVLGKRGVISYLVAISSVALLFGTMIDSLGFSVPIPMGSHLHHEHSGGFLQVVAAWILWGLVIWRVGIKVWSRSGRITTSNLPTSPRISVPSSNPEPLEETSMNPAKHP